MADLSKALQTFYSTFASTNTDFKLEKKQQKDNNIMAVNKLLDSLLGSDEDRAKYKEAITTASGTSTYSTTSSSAAVPLPSFNARAPYVEVWINGLLVVPNNDMVDSAYMVDPTPRKDLKPGEVQIVEKSLAKGMEEYVAPESMYDWSGMTEDLDVSFQSCELSMPIGGVASTISANLVLYSRTPVELLGFLTNVGSSEDSGFPVCKLRFGWSIPRVDGKTEQILTPLIPFLVTNTAMSDPGKTMGSEFTLTLQDAGSAVVQNSSCNAGLKEDYPQQQLRVLIEKYLGLRLFTLDDLLLLGENEKNREALGLSKTTVKFKATDGVKVSYEIGLIGTQAGLTNAQILQNRTGYLSAYNAQKQAGVSEEEAIRLGVITNKTFFVCNPTPALRINSNTIETVINKLLGLISCRWYTTYNNELNNEIVSASEAEADIREFKKKLDLGTLTGKDVADFETAKERMATSCVLIWIPHFPANVYSTSNTTYGSDIANEEGAFLLLPKITTDYSLDALSLPLIYGPGGSSLPYFYGGAQNVFARLTDEIVGIQGVSHRVGEILDLSANFSNLVELMKNIYDEEMAYREVGKFLSTFNAVKLTKEQKKLQRQKQKEKSEKELKAKVGDNSPDKFIAKWEEAMTPKFKAVRGRFRGTIAPRYLVNSVEYTSTADSTSSNTTAARSLATNILKHRIGTFLNYSYSVGISLLGDPYLIRQGIGAFEIINYYPTADGKLFKYNPFVSGVYFPVKITHKISIGDYTTEIQALKVPGTVKDSAKAKVEYTVHASELTSASNESTADAIASNVAAAFGIMQVNLDTLEAGTISDNEIYKLSDAQAKAYAKLWEAERDRINAYTPAQKAALAAKYSTPNSAVTFEEARAKEINAYQISVLVDMVDKDPALTEQSADVKRLLKARIKTLHGAVINSAPILSQTIAGAQYKNGNYGNIFKLEEAYKRLQEEQYNKIRENLSKN